MACGFGVLVGDRLRPCGKCQSCLRKRRNAWTGRMLMEQSQHSETCFITLTYAEEHLPLRYHMETGEWIPSLEKSHLQNFLRSVRKKAMRLEVPLRYFAAGEYGDKGGRPHYHAILFGTGPFWIDLYRDSWKYGFVSAYEATPRSMSYVAKYCLKGSRDPELDVPLSGSVTSEQLLSETRYSVAPFRLTSRRPAIGATFAPSIADSLAITMKATPDLAGKHTTQIRLDGTKYPLDRTMKDHIHLQLVERSVEPEAIDSLLKPDFGNPTDEEIQKGRQTHIKALHSRNARTKL